MAPMMEALKLLTNDNTIDQSTGNKEDILMGIED
jgi:hypothetical protein